jgi:hypothetical protein
MTTHDDHTYVSDAQTLACADMLRTVAKLAHAVEWYFGPAQGRNLAIFAAHVAADDLESAMTVRDHIRSDLLQARTEYFQAVFWISCGLLLALASIAVVSWLAAMVMNAGGFSRFLSTVELLVSQLRSTCPG